MRHQHLGRALAIVASALSITTAVFSRLLEAEDWSVWQIAATRGLFGAIFVGLVYRRRVMQIRNGIPMVALYATLMVFCVILWIYAVIHAPVGITLSLLFLGPIWVVLYECLFEHKRRPHLILTAGLALVGTLMIASTYSWRLNELSWGVVAALTCSFTFAASLVVGRKTTKRVDAVAMPFWTLVLLTVAFGWQLFDANWSLSSVAPAISIGVISGGIMLTCFALSLKLIPTTSEAGILMYSEVLFGWILSWAYYHEQVSLLAVIGGVFILIAGLIVALSSTNGKLSPEPST